MFEILRSQNRYAVVHRITTAKRADTRARRIEQFVAMLERGERTEPGCSTGGRAAFDALGHERISERRPVRFCWSTA
jgi:Bacteriocin-protection, YdeI or OmpD-Associated